MKKKMIVAAILSLIGLTTLQAQNWFQIPSGTTSKLNTIDFPSASVGYIGGNDSLLLKTTDGGENWSIINFSGVSFFPGDENIINLQFVTENIGFMAIGAHAGSYKTIDGGLTWSPITNLNSCFSQGLFFIDENNGFIGGSGCFQGEMMDQLNAGVWSAATVNLPGLSADLRVVDIDFLNSSFGLAASTSGYILRTTDGGDNWDTIPTPGVTAMNPLTSVLVVNANLAYAGYESVNVGFGLYVSTDNGLTWQEDMNSATFLYPDFLTLHQSGNNNVYTGGRSENMTSGVIFTSPNNPTSWNYDMVNEFINDISSYNDSIVFAVGENGYIVSNKVFSTSMSVNDVIENDLISVYPNPTQSTLTINSNGIEINSMKLYAINGEIILNEKFQSTLDINSVANGIYFLELETPNGMIRKKVIKN